MAILSKEELAALKVAVLCLTVHTEEALRQSMLSPDLCRFNKKRLAAARRALRKLAAENRSAQK